MKEADIIHETANLWLSKDLCIWLTGSTHSVCVGKSKSIEAAKRFMESSERYIDRLRSMYQHWR